MISWIEWVLVVVRILLRVAFITLYERKILGLTQNRLGPNKTVFKGLLQPLLDALKLLSKPSVILSHNYSLYYHISAMLAFIIRLLFWISLPLLILQESKFLVLWLLLLFGLGTYSLLLAGWRSSSKFRIIGGWRRLRQAISYEVILAFIVLALFLLNSSLRKSYYFFFPILFFSLLWLVVMLTETQRAPFDLTEGERELVSGFNTEYRGTLFTFLFLGEYGRILALRGVSSYLWWNWRIRILIWFRLWMWIRTCYPRIRYDKLINFFWKLALPILVIIWLGFLRTRWWS